jgi:hypothetical protein
VGRRQERGIAALPASPYKYLDYYGLNDREIFFGREAEIITLLADIVVSRLVVLFAKTGTGKTSLINAGVRPRLEERQYKTFIVQVRQDPTASFRRELGLSHASSKSLREELENLSRETYKKPLVLFFDQFEEFFTYIGADSPEGQKFISEVADIYENRDSGVHIIFSMREEWFYELDAFRDKIPTIFHNESNLRLRWFDEDQAREAIKRPAEKFGVIIEEGLVDSLIADLSENGKVEPAQLQIICDTLWREREQDQIKLSHYQKSGQHSGEPNIARQILYRRLETEFEKIEAEEQLRLLCRLLPLLRTPPPRSIKYVRDIVGLTKELETDEESLQDLIQRLETSQLIRTGRRDTLPVIELVHDYLIDYLDTLAIRAKAVWPSRLLRTGLEAYLVSGRLLKLDDLEKVSEYLTDKEVKHRVLGSAEVGLLFRSSLEYGIDMLAWFNLASGYGIPAWDVLRESLRAGSGKGTGDEYLVRASNTVYLLTQLLADGKYAAGAFELLQYALGQQLLAPMVVKNLERYETTLAVSLLQMALAYKAVSLYANGVLKLFAGSRSEDVATAAKTALGTAKIDEDKVEDRGRGRSAARPKGEEAERVHPLDESLGTHFITVSRQLMEGRLIILLGSDINLAGRPPGATWIKGESLPSNSELASYLGEIFYYPQDEVIELTRVAQYASVLLGKGPLYEALDEVFKVDYSPTLVHQFCASLPAKFRENKPAQGSNPIRQRLVFVTTNYDKVMERAFEEAGEPCHILSYIAATDNYELEGKFLHHSPDGRTAVILERNYMELGDDSYPIIIKMYGSVELSRPLVSDNTYSSRSNYVISEDDHFWYSSHADLSASLPAQITATLRMSGFLVMGHHAHSWHERALLYSLWEKTKLRYRSWTVSPHMSSFERGWLTRQNVEEISLSFEEYIEKVTSHI